MIKELHIQNFQSHKDTRLKFHPGVNIVVGTSDSGKSAIIRALRWAAWNKPLGDAYRSRWGGDTSVQVKTTDDTVLRFKGKGGDRYELGSIETPFKAFGTNVPEEIERSANLTEVNLQSQMDSHYLLSSNPGEVARHFNKIARIDAIDTGLQEVERWIRACNQEVSKTEANISQYQQEVDSYKWVSDFEIRLEAIQSMSSMMGASDRAWQGLQTTIQEIESTQDEAVALQEFLELGDLVEDISDSYDELDGLASKLTALEGLIDVLESIHTDRRLYQNLASRETDFDGLLDEIDELADLKASFRDLASLGKSIKECRTQVNDARDLYNKKHANLLEQGGLCTSCPFI